MNTYGKAVVAFADNGRGFAVLWSHGSVRDYLRRFGPRRLLDVLTPDPTCPIMAWEGYLDVRQLDSQVDGRWRECSKTELADCLKEWVRPGATDPDAVYGQMLADALAPQTALPAAAG